MNSTLDGDGLEIIRDFVEHVIGVFWPAVGTATTACRGEVVEGESRAFADESAAAAADHEPGGPSLEEADV